jgi:hypothetical protein
MAEAREAEEQREERRSPPPDATAALEFGDGGRPRVTCTVQRGRYLLTATLAATTILIVLAVANLVATGETTHGVNAAVRRAGKKFFEDLAKNDTFWEGLARTMTRVLLKRHDDDDDDDDQDGPHHHNATTPPYSSEG